MLTVFFDYSGVVHSEFLPEGQTVNKEYYLSVMKRLRGNRFQAIEDIKENSRRELKSIPKNAFKKRFDDWIIRWHECIISGGAYFEGDRINLDD